MRQLYKESKMNAQITDELKTQFLASIALAGDDIYTKASKMLFKTIAPSVVLRPTSSKEVAEMIRFIKKHNLPFAIRSGGHSNIASRLQKDIVLIDMTGLSSVTITDEGKGLVRVGSGALWHEVASKLHPYNLGISSGDTRTVGVGGLATGGGLGWMVRKYGPVIDTIVSAEVVTANGEIMEVNEHENADLFWAIRGGGSNFGIVTYFTFQAHRVEGIFVGQITYDIKDIAAVLMGWRDAMRKAPRELTTMLMTFPGMGDAPASVMIKGCFDGTDLTAAEQAFAPFLTFAAPTSHTMEAKPYKDVLEDGMPIQGIRVIVHDAFLKELSDETIRTVVELCRDSTPILQIRHLSGAMNERPADITAFSHRDSEVLIVNPSFVSPSATEEEIAQATAHWSTIEKFSQGVYLNLISEDTGKEVEQAFSPDALKRLRQIKAKYDPDNIFNANYNITPLK